MKNQPLRRVERLELGTSIPREGMGGWAWRPIRFSQLKAGDIFRLWDTNDQGYEIPDIVVKGQHQVCVALEDAERCCKVKCSGKNLVKSMPVRGFKGPVYKGWKPAWSWTSKEKKDGKRKQSNTHIRS
jgi:hypothetical protein